jgi:hypothetical protein
MSTVERRCWLSAVATAPGTVLSRVTLVAAPSFAWLRDDLVECGRYRSRYCTECFVTLVAATEFVLLPSELRRR